MQFGENAFSHPAFAGVIGVGREDITPPVGIYARDWGAAEHDQAEGVHRPLTLTALTLQDALEGPPCVLIALDLGWWKTWDDEWFLRGGLIEALQLDPDRVLLNLLHTHAGPSVTRADATQRGGDLIAPYLESVLQAAIAAVQRALASAQPAVLEWSYGRCDLATNRDLRDPQAPRDEPRIVCGFNPSGHADDTMLVGRVTQRGNTDVALATIVNYACHPTTLAWTNNLLSPDYVGAMREVVEVHTGGAPCLFLQGASGELSPRQQYEGDVEVADKNGRQLGFAVLSTLEGMLPPRTVHRFEGTVASGAPLAVWRAVDRDFGPGAEVFELEVACVEVELKLKDLPSGQDIENQMRSCTDRALREQLLRKGRVRRYVGEEAFHSVPLWGWRVGEAFIVAQMTEAYSDWQLELRAEFPGRAIVVMNLTNGSIGYTPPRHLYSEDIYQVWQSPYECGCLEELTRVGQATIRQFL